MYKRFIPPLAVLMLLVAFQGCKSGERCSLMPRRPACDRCGDGPIPPRFTPVPVPPRNPPIQAPLTEVPAPPPDTREPPPPPVRMGPPRIPNTEERRDSALKPDSKEPPVASIPAMTEAEDDDKDDPPPIELPGFAVARPNVASGLKPFTDGITWLKSHGYKTVLHLREPGEDNAAAKRLFEGKGLKYVSLEASPARLTKELLAQFAKVVDDKKTQPLFVYDKDGSAAGGLWYLYFRVTRKETDAKARKEATRLGLRINDDDVEHKTMWIAIQALLKAMK